MHRGPTKTCAPPGSRVIEAYIPPWAKEEGTRVQGLKGEAQTSQEDEMFGEAMFSMPCG